MKNKDVIFISVSVGWAIRNFFQTGVMEQLSEKFRIIVLTTENFKQGIINLGLDNNFDFIVHDLEKEPYNWRIVRQIKKKLYLEYRRSNTDEIWKTYVKRPLYQRLGDLLFKIAKRYINLMSLFNWIDRNQHYILRTNELNDAFFDLKPKYLFTTQISDYFDEYILKNAKQCNIPIIYMVMSWDHLSSKVVLSNYFHSILVWNKITYNEILNTYTYYKSAQIRIVGIPQFDKYFERSDLTYDEWCQKMNLDPKKKTIYYSAAPYVRHEQQGKIIEDLISDIREGLVFPNDLQILFKSHPLDNVRRYQYLEDFGNIKVIGNISNSNNKINEKWIPSQDELIFQRDCLEHCFLNINIFSTVTLEAAFFNKPIIHIAFDPLPIKNRIPCAEYYNFDHFKPIVDIGASILVSSRMSLNEAIVNYLNNPNLHFKERQNIVNEYWELSKFPATNYLVNELKLLADSDLIGR